MSCHQTFDTFNSLKKTAVLPQTKQISNHARPMVLSYLWIRRAVGSLGLALPIILGPGGWLFLGVEIQENMSSYYHTPMRDIFVGVMCAIGLFLFCYVGTTQFENWTGNLGCVAAIGVALFPIDAGADPLFQATFIGYLHTLFGGLFFLTLALFSIYHFPHSEPEDDSDQWNWGRNEIFRTSGATLLLSVAAMVFFLFVLDRPTRDRLSEWDFIFWGEWIAVWAFAIAWLVKGRTVLLLLESLEAVKTLKK
ncbi:MAG: hypothetical protein AB8B55_11885 [Mariniblastus sp.]